MQNLVSKEDQKLAVCFMLLLKTPIVYVLFIFLFLFSFFLRFLICWEKVPHKYQGEIIP